ncbi:MAG: hypothetical protein ACXACY_28255 [Candidatus Hodarchaeales archaeon]|jgi:hypothetical protein
MKKILLFLVILSVGAYFTYQKFGGSSEAFEAYKVYAEPKAMKNYKEKRHLKRQRYGSTNTESSVLSFEYELISEEEAEDGQLKLIVSEIPQYDIFDQSASIEYFSQHTVLMKKADDGSWKVLDQEKQDLSKIQAAARAKVEASQAPVKTKAKKLELTLGVLALIALVLCALWVLGLWLAKTLTGVWCTFPRLLLIAILPILVFIIPIPVIISYIIAVILMYVLIVKLTDADFFPDAVFMVVIANILSTIMLLVIISNPKLLNF